MSGVVQTGYAPPHGPPARPTPGWPRWLVVAAVLWALLLAGLTWLSVREDPPTVREQRTLTQAGPVVDRAIGELVAAAGEEAIVELAPPAVEQDCRLTPFADGATLERAVLVWLPGVEPDALLDRIADALPARYRAGVPLTREGPRLRADAGEFVTVRGRETLGGALRLTADTGCRPIGSGYLPPSAYATAETDAATAALRVLGRPAEDPPDLVTAPCPGDGDRTSRTVWLTAGPGAPWESLPAALAPLAAGTALIDTPEVYAYRAGPVVVQAHLIGERLRVSATSVCR